MKKNKRKKHNKGNKQNKCNLNWGMIISLIAVAVVLIKVNSLKQQIRTLEHEIANMQQQEELQDKPETSKVRPAKPEESTTPELSVATPKPSYEKETRDTYVKVGLYEELLKFYKDLQVLKHVDTLKDRQWRTKTESPLFPDRYVEVFISNDRAYIDEIAIMHYDIALDKDENIIVSGLDLYRNYYEFTFSSNNVMLASGGQNGDVLDEGKQIVGTCEKGTLTFQSGVLELWDKGVNLATCNIPEPKEICENFFGEYGKRANNLYISKAGELVLLQTYESQLYDTLGIKCNILESNVKRIVDSFEYNVFQRENGTYAAVIFADYEGSWYSNFCFNQLELTARMKPSIIPLNNQTVENCRFGTWGSSGPDKSTISFWTINFAVKGYYGISCEAYRPDEPIIIDEEFEDFMYDIMGKEFPPSEYAAKYDEIVRKTMEYEK